uniref:Uncharacterized protein n=1 Tax=Ascaris lumbricoides TaxID=6252 RepID=A0A9J2P4E8_ASCLU
MSLTSRLIRCLMPVQARTAFSAAPQCTTGIEHAEELKKKELGPSRLPQPSNKVPAVEPRVTKK